MKLFTNWCHSGLEHDKTFIRRVEMAEKIIKLSAAGGIPDCEIVIGQAQFGKYQAFVWDTTGHNPLTVCSGTNDDTVPDRFPISDSNCGSQPASAIKSVQDLDKRIFSWEVIVAALGAGPGQLFSVTVRITQDGAPVPGGNFTQSGPLNGAQLVYDHVRFIVI
jgi:hypothetical protein